MGPLKGRTLGSIGPVWQTTAEAGLADYPDIEIAISDRPIREGGRRTLFDRVRGLGRGFRRTMGNEDARRPTMDVGVGVWTEDQSHAKYYSLEDVQVAGDVLIDTFAGRRVLVYFAPGARSLMVAYSPASSASWEGDDLHLTTGHVLSRGVLRDAQGNRVDLDAPLQVFTRWYGFSLTFPETEIWRP